jgi:hypothetical protein
MAGCSALNTEAPALTQQTDALETLLADMPWVSAKTSDHKIVYQFSFRTCPPCIRFKKEAWPDLEKAGVQTRLVMTARRSRSSPNERTAVVELARTRDWTMAQDWMKSNSPKGYYRKMDFTAADGNAAREADLEKLRGQIDLLDKLLTANGIDMAYPTLLWQDADNIWRAEVGYYSGMAQDIIASLEAN